MPCILDFTMYFPSTLQTYCGSFIASRLVTNEKNKKKPPMIDNALGSMREISARRKCTLSSAKIFFLQKTWHYLSTWDAPHIWLHHGVRLLADMKAAISNTASFFPKDISLFLLYSYHLDTYFWTVSLLLSLVDNCLHSQFGNYRFLLIPSTFSDLEFSTALDCIFTIIITEFITTNNSSKTQHPQYHYVTFVIPSNTHSSYYLVHHQYTFLEALYSVI